jgi:hypothetical protein
MGLSSVGKPAGMDFDNQMRWLIIYYTRYVGPTFNLTGIEKVNKYTWSVDSEQDRLDIHGNPEYKFVRVSEDELTKIKAETI